LEATAGMQTCAFSQEIAENPARLRAAARAEPDGRSRAGAPPTTAAGQTPPPATLCVCDAAG